MLISLVLKVDCPESLPVRRLDLEQIKSLSDVGFAEDFVDPLRNALVAVSFGGCDAIVFDEYKLFGRSSLPCLLVTLTSEGLATLYGPAAFFPIVTRCFWCAVRSISCLKVGLINCLFTLTGFGMLGFCVAMPFNSY